MHADEVLVGQNEGQFVHAAGLLLGPIAPHQGRSFGIPWVWYGWRASSSFLSVVIAVMFVTYSVSHLKENGFEAVFLFFLKSVLLS